MTSLSVCCIDTVNQAQAASSVMKTLACLPQHLDLSVRWFSNTPFGYHTHVPVHWHKILEISEFPLDYNRITLNMLPKLAQEDFVLIVQADGHAVSAHAWNDEFLKYDYIGPPFNTHWLPDHSLAVGNGGFSLRSGKLLHALADMDVKATNRGEDVVICWDLKNILTTQYDIKFAPLEVANQFAQDLNLNLKFGPSPNLHWMGKSFGFHGLHEATQYYGDQAGAILPGYMERTGALKIAVYTIALNEEKFVDTWFESVRDADYCLVLDTGSTDQTVSQLRHRGVKCEVIHLKPWRFDLARNFALSLIPADVDVCISMDMDEHMAPGWRTALEAAWTPETTRLRYSYLTHYSHKPEAELTYWADKIHARHNYVWKRPVHETVFCEVAEHVAQSDQVIMHHRPDGAKSRSSYLPLLELSHKENADCNQTLFWLAREHAHMNQPEQATMYFKKLLSREHVWHLERSESERWLHKLLPHDSLRWIRQAVATAPERRECWLDLARYYYNTQDWCNCYAACVSALKITQPTHSYLDTQEPWGSILHDLAAVSAWNMGLHKQSEHHAEKACELSPHDERLKNNLQVIKQTISDK